MDPNWQPVDGPDTFGFWANVAVSEPDVCWGYKGPGSMTPGGHMRITWNHMRTYAHRVAFRLAGGVLDDVRPWVLHERCSWGLCCNPRCLIAGDALLNAQHRDQANRRTPFLPRGSESAAAKLSAREVQAVVEGKAAGVSADQLARMFGVSRRSIYNVLSATHYAQEVAVAMGAISDAEVASLVDELDLHVELQQFRKELARQ